MRRGGLLFAFALLAIPSGPMMQLKHSPKAMLCRCCGKAGSTAGWTATPNVLQVTNRGEQNCGAVEVTATGEPAAMGYCHCESCRHWSAGPVNAFTLWPPANVKITPEQPVWMAGYASRDRPFESVHDELEAALAGGSMRVRASTWSTWFCTMSRSAPACAGETGRARSTTRRRPGSSPRVSSSIASVARSRTAASETPSAVVLSSFDPVRRELCFATAGHPGARVRLTLYQGRRSVARLRRLRSCSPRATRGRRCG